MDKITVKCNKNSKLLYLKTAKLVVKILQSTFVVFGGFISNLQINPERLLLVLIIQNYHTFSLQMYFSYSGP